MNEGLDRAILDWQLVAVDADQRPDLAVHRLPEPRLAAKEAVNALEVAWFTPLGFVPCLAVVLRTPQEIGTASAIVIDSEEQRSIREFA